MEEQLEQLVAKWHTQANHLEDGLSSGKWMSEEEKKDFNQRRDKAYYLRCCAMELKTILLKNK